MGELITFSEGLDIIGDKAIRGEITHEDRERYYWKLCEWAELNEEIEQEDSE